MRIDSKIVNMYLNGENLEGLESHWIYSSIIRGENIFEMPDKEKRAEISQIKKEMLQRLEDFEPLNKKIFSKLFPKYKEILESVCVFLVVGCPSPYEAMVLEHDGEYYIVFDLTGFLTYKDYGHDMSKVICQLITHETTHKCLLEDYNLGDNATYMDKMEFLVFNEGLAHMLAFKDGIEDIEWEKYDEHYLLGKKVLRQALKEKDDKKQREWIERAGAAETYWEKFGSVVGKVYFGKNIDRIEELYAKGFKGISDRV